MENWIYLTNFGVAVSGLVISLIGLILSLTVQYTEKGYRRFFVLIFSVLIAYVSSNLPVWVVSEIPGKKYMIISTVFLFFESFFSSLLPPILTAFLLFCAKKNWRKSPYFYTAVVLWLIYFVLLVINLFTQWFYYYTPDNQYFRGPFYALLLVPPVLLMAVNLFALYRLRASYSKLIKYTFLTYILIPLVCMLIQMFIYGLLMTVLGSTVSALIMMLTVLMGQVSISIKQAQENARQKASIAVLQMRPHFIYNTMMSIYYLCAQDAEKAQQVTLDFTSYLRKNFTAIVKEDTIPFSEELEHTRAYLAVEKVRFEGQLFVEFDTPVTTFRLPPLTLQPIVENAVKYGVDPELDPLYISVRTCETKRGFVVVVEDTGPGFETNDNNEPHIALDNIRERLDLMCGGTLTVSDREQGGTVVTVFIPHKYKKA